MLVPLGCCYLKLESFLKGFTHNIKDQSLTKICFIFIPFLYSNIPLAPAYGVYVSQLIRCSRASPKYVDFVALGILLSQKFLRQGYESIKLRSSLKKFYGRHHELIGHYDKSVSEIIFDIHPQS